MAHGTKRVGLAGAGQSEGQDIDAAVHEVAVGQLSQLLLQSQGHTVVLEGLPGLAAGSLDAVRSRPMRRCRRSSASCSSTSRKVERASPWPAVVKRDTDCAPMVGNRN